MIRRKYSSPCKHGAVIAAKILNDPLLFDQWKMELK
jgi:aspartate/tyrosine/aromatic aminotransferase